MAKVNFYDSINDSMLKFAVIIARHNGKWVFCKHKERNTWEAPGGHREDGEDILETAKRELYEETGAITFDIRRIFEIALERSRCRPENAVMIGDRIDNDIVPAKQLGMKTIWIKQGFGSLWTVMDESEKADIEVNNLSDILNYL